MAKVKLEIVSPEGILYSDEVDMVVAPGVEGRLGIPIHHAPLISALEIGELKVSKDGEEEYFAVHGGFMEVRANTVTVLVDVAERAEEIDVERAEAARRRAEELLREGPPGVDLSQLQGALRRSVVRLRTARRKSRRARGRPPLQTSERPEGGSITT